MNMRHVTVGHETIDLSHVTGDVIITTRSGDHDHVTMRTRLRGPCNRWGRGRVTSRCGIVTEAPFYVHARLHSLICARTFYSARDVTARVLFARPSLRVT